MYLRENKMAILRKTDKGMAKAMYGDKLIENKNIQEIMDLLGWTNL